MAVKKAVIDPHIHMQILDPSRTSPYQGLSALTDARTRFSRRALEWRKHFSIFTGLAYKHLQRA
jgi:hypothetical protein